MPKRDPYQDIIDDEEGLITEDQATESWHERERQRELQLTRDEGDDDEDFYAEDSEYHAFEDDMEASGGNKLIHYRTAANKLGCTVETLDRIIASMCSSDEDAFARHPGNGKVYLVRRDVLRIASKFGENRVHGFEVPASFEGVRLALKLPI
jgi:hypothetical protein